MSNTQFKITPATFNALTLQKKCVITWDNATFFIERSSYNRYIIRYFALSDYYIYIRHDLKLGRATDAGAFTFDDDEMDILLRDINLKASIIT